ncbi:MAG: hypothetical protein WCP93_03795 [Candidatus Berkelbacteria bacterium]
MVTYFSWWYGQGLVNFWRAIIIMTGKVYSFFSITILTRTLFDPWKHDEAWAENASLQTRMNIFLNNMISRLIGFVIRLFTVILGLFIGTTFFLIFFCLWLAWILLPIIVIGLIVNGLKVVING